MASDVIAGSIGGVAQVFVGHPLDSLKVRMQTQTTGKYGGMMSGMATIFREEGVRGFYKGVQSPLAGLSAINAIVFASYTKSKNLLRKDASDPLSIGQLFCAGAMVGTAVSLVEAPVDLFKSQLQVQYGGSIVPKYSGFFDCAKKITTTYGIRGVFQGYSAAIVKIIPNYAAYFGFYEMSRRTFARGYGGNVDLLPAPYVLAAGGIAGTLSWLVIYPLDVVKSKMQCDSTEPSQRVYRTLGSTIQQVYRTQGFRGFWVGVAPCLVRAFPANAVCFLVYDRTRRLFDKA